MNSVSASSKLLGLRVVLEILRTAGGVRGDHDLVDYPHPLQLANLYNTHQQQCPEKDNSEHLGYYLAMTRKVVGFLSQAFRTLFFPNFFPSILLSTFFSAAFSSSFSSYWVRILEDFLLNLGGPLLQSYFWRRWPYIFWGLLPFGLRYSKGRRQDGISDSDALCICLEFYWLYMHMRSKQSIWLAWARPVCSGVCKYLSAHFGCQQLHPKYHWVPLTLHNNISNVHKSRFEKYKGRSIEKLYTISWDDYPHINKIMLN